MSQATKLREMLARPGMIVAPGIYDGMSARLGRMAGFEALYATGGGIARSTGVPPTASRYRATRSTGIPPNAAPSCAAVRGRATARDQC